MQPVVHLAVGYICYAGYTRLAHRETPGSKSTIVVLFAALLPDLIDKSLWIAGLVPVGRTIGHSLLFAVPLVFLVWYVLHKRDREKLAIAFAIGYGSHIATDIPWHVLAGEYEELGFLLWPITHMPAYTGTKTIGTVAGAEITTLWVEAVILAFGIALWLSDGRPGLILPDRNS